MCEPKPGSSHCEVTVPPAEPLNRPYIGKQNQCGCLSHTCLELALFLIFILLSETSNALRRDFPTLCVINFLMGCEKRFPLVTGKLSSEQERKQHVL